MEKINNNFENNSDEDSVCDNEREITIFISRIGSRVYTHTNQRSGVPEQLDGEEIKNKDAEQIKSIQNIIDISTITKGKSSNEIAMIAIKCLNPAIYIEDLSKIQFSKCESTIEERPDIQSEFNDDPFNLKCRKRHQKLTDSQIRFLKCRINESILTTREISNEYHISTSEIYKIKRMSISQIMKGSKRKCTKLFGKDKDNLMKEIKNFISDASYAFNSSEITNHVNTKIQKNYKSSWIRSIMKNKLNLTYKRIKPRPNSINFDKVKACRQLFAIKFSQLLSKNSLVINIDETSINRHIKINYSWSLKGKQYEARNSPFVGSINCVMAICSNGNWFSLLMNHTSNSDNFEIFLMRLNCWLMKNNYFGYDHTIMTMDNSSIHKCKNVVKMLSKMKVDIIYLPAYSPQFAPIEMCFSMIKSKLRTICSKGVVKLHLKSSIIEICKALKQVKPNVVKHLFKNMYSSINKYI